MVEEKGSNSSGYVLVLGGSSFMGLTLLQGLMETTQLKVCFINRGNNYWDNKVGDLLKKYSQKLYFTKTKGGRDKTLLYQEALKQIFEVHGKNISAIIDFCCFSQGHML
jgi:hypothetical protein